MGITETDLYEQTLRDHGMDVADDAHRIFSWGLAEKHGVERGWTIALNRALETDRAYAHETGAVRRSYAYTA